MPDDPLAATRPTVGDVVGRMLGLIDSDAAADLATEDTATAVEVHFAPVRVMSLPNVRRFGDNCSTDGYYEAHLDPTRPTIIFDSSVSPTRARFTILHELGHHIFATDGAHLLDDLDRIGRSAAGAARAEEMACHEFAGRVLVPEGMIAEVIDDKPLVPAHLAELRRRTTASWDAIAVRCVNWVQARVAVVLVRESGFVHSAVSSPRLGDAWWPRDSPVNPDGPLDRALQRDHIAAKETYRAGLSFSEQLYCDSLRVHDGLALCVLSDRPSDGRFDLLEPPEPAWKEREEFCSWDGDERDHGWCDRCNGQLCRSCGRCGCEQPLASPICSGCGLPAPLNPGHRFCHTCVLDGREE